VVHYYSKIRPRSARSIGVGLDFGGSPGTRPPIIGNRPCICQFLPHFAPLIFGFEIIPYTAMMNITIRIATPKNSKKFTDFDLKKVTILT